MSQKLQRPKYILLITNHDTTYFLAEERDQWIVATVTEGGLRAAGTAHDRLAWDGDSGVWLACKRSVLCMERLVPRSSTASKSQLFLKTKGLWFRNGSCCFITPCYCFHYFKKLVATFKPTFHNSKFWNIPNYCNSSDTTTLWFHQGRSYCVL